MYIISLSFGSTLIAAVENVSSLFNFFHEVPKFVVLNKFPPQTPANAIGDPDDAVAKECIVVKLK